MLASGASGLWNHIGVDQFDGVAPAPQPLNHEFGAADADPVGRIGVIADEGSIDYRDHSAT